MSDRPRRPSRQWYQSRWALTLLALAALGVWLSLPALAAPPVDVVDQDSIVVNAVDNDPDNRLWDCATRRVPFGNEDLDMLRCFTFRYQVPAEGIVHAALHVAVEPQGSLQDTDALVVAVGEAFPNCAWGQGEMPGCVPLHGGFQGGETSLNLNLLDIACDASMQGSPEAQQALLTQLQTGVLHFMLQDDTSVLGAQLVLNGGPPTVPCGTSTQPWVVQPATGAIAGGSLASTLSRLVTGTADAKPPSPGAVAGAAAAATATLGGYVVLNGWLGRAAARRTEAMAGAASDGAARAAPGQDVSNTTPTARVGPTGNTPALAAPPADAGSIGESDLRDALDRFKDHLEGLAEPKAERVARLVVSQGRASKLAVVLTAGPVTIGRDASNTLALYDQSVSRRHAVVNPESGAWVLSDLNSANGTLVNGTRVTRCVLRPGDQIRLGDVVLVFEGAGSAGWVCQRCTRANPPGSQVCEQCGTRRPQGG